MTGLFLWNFPVLELELKEDSTDDFLDMGKDWMNSEFGLRYVKYSDDQEEHVIFGGGYYIGEWSSKTNEPHGRGIYINKYNWITIGYFKDGSLDTGKYFIIYSDDGGFEVGKKTRDANW